MSYGVTCVVLAPQAKVPFLLVGLAGLVVLAALVRHKIVLKFKVFPTIKTPPTKLLILACFATP